MMFEVIGTWILLLITLAIGYYWGSGKKPIETLEKIKSDIKKSFTEVGPVNRPTSEVVIHMSDKRREEEDEAFKASFLKEHPELKEKIKELQKI